MTTPSEAPPATGLGALAVRSPLALAGNALPWLIAVVFYFTAEGYLSLGTQVLIWILVALSLDLALGYAGIVTLGHAAFFGFGAYAAGLFAIHVSPDPILGHLTAIVLSALLGVVTGALILHTTGVTFLMLTLAIVSIMFEDRHGTTFLAFVACWAGPSNSLAATTACRGSRSPRSSASSSSTSSGRPPMSMPSSFCSSGS